jgi:hypothetical protein
MSLYATIRGKEKYGTFSKMDILTSVLPETNETEASKGINKN